MVARFIFLGSDNVGNWLSKPLQSIGSVEVLPIAKKFNREKVSIYQQRTIAWGQSARL